MAIVVILAAVGIYAICNRLYNDFNRLVDVYRELVNAKADSASLRRQMTADLSTAWKMVQNKED